MYLVPRLSELRQAVNDKGASQEMKSLYWFTPEFIFQESQGRGHEFIVKMKSIKLIAFPNDGGTPYSNRAGLATGVR
jgi:hypothetical protein